MLLDLGLPDSPGGLETLRQVHDQDRDIAIVVLTGERDTELALAAVREGAQDYLVKEGIGGDKVWQTVRYAIERRLHQEDEAALRAAQQELRAASEIQRARFPRNIPQLDGYDMFGACRPAARRR